MVLVPVTQRVLTPVRSAASETYVTTDLDSSRVGRIDIHRRD